MSDFDLAAAARREMTAQGFNPAFPSESAAQLASIAAKPAPVASGAIQDLRHLPWSSIDNDTSRDLDQIEFAERTATGIRVLVGIADVDAAVDIHSPLDQHATSETTSVYTNVLTFPMLPEPLSTDLTSLNEQGGRYGIVIEYTAGTDGSIVHSDIYRAVIANKAQLTYSAVGPWLEGTAQAPAKLAASPELAAQVKLQDEAACAMRNLRHKMGALDFDRTEAQVSIHNGKVESLAARKKNRAGDLIEDFMIAANQIMAQSLARSGSSFIQRVVKSPERWNRIVQLAAGYGETLPIDANSSALNDFLKKRKVADPVHYQDLSLAVMKLMGPGEYAVTHPGETSPGHFSLAAQTYSHSTAPNRRFADIVTQRLIKAMLAHQPSPYSDAELEAIALNCTLKENAARKVERNMNKRIAAVALAGRIGDSFHAVVTGVTPKGTFVRVLELPAEGRLMQGEHGVDVGDQITVKLLHTDPQSGFIDFGR